MSRAESLHGAAEQLRLQLDRAKAQVAVREQEAREAASQAMQLARDLQEMEAAALSLDQQLEERAAWWVTIIQ